MNSPFTVKKNDGTTDVVYTPQGSTLDSATWIDTTSTLSAPRSAKLVHNVKPIGSVGSDRHTLTFQSVVMDTNGVPHVISTTFGLTVPRAAVVTDTLILDCISALQGCLAAPGVKAALIDGIIF